VIALNPVLHKLSRWWQERFLAVENLSMDQIASMFVLLLFVVDYGIYDIVSFDRLSGNEAGR